LHLIAAASAEAAQIIKYFTEVYNDLQSASGCYFFDFVAQLLNDLPIYFLLPRHLMLLDPSKLLAQCYFLVCFCLLDLPYLLLICLKLKLLLICKKLSKYNADWKPVHSAMFLLEIEVVVILVILVVTAASTAVAVLVMWLMFEPALQCRT